MNLDESFQQRVINMSTSIYMYWFYVVNNKYIIYLFKQQKETKPFNELDYIDAAFYSYNPDYALCAGSGADKNLFLHEILHDNKSYPTSNLSNATQVVYSLHRDELIRVIQALENEGNEAKVEVKTIAKSSCKECGGTGIIDMEFYTRKCSCVLGG